MKTVIVLAMHGSLPNDFPTQELRRFFEIHSLIENSPQPVDEDTRREYFVLEEKLKGWPRNPDNDPYHAASLELVQDLTGVSGYEVFLGYNEFCAPSIEQALEKAADTSAEKIIVATNMLTRGGNHAEKDIPEAIRRFKALHPNLVVVYAWPFESKEVAVFLSQHIKGFSRTI